MDYFSHSVLRIAANLVVSSWAYLLCIHSCCSGFIHTFRGGAWGFTGMSSSRIADNILCRDVDVIETTHDHNNAFLVVITVLIQTIIKYFEHGTYC